jgi:hypothetical protein
MREPLVSADSIEFYADDEGRKYVNFAIYSDGSLEIDVTNGTREGRYGDEFTNYTDLKFTPEQTTDLFAILQAWMEQL